MFVFRIKVRRSVILSEVWVGLFQWREIFNTSMGYKIWFYNINTYCIYNSRFSITLSSFKKNLINHYSYTWGEQRHREVKEICTTLTLSQWQDQENPHIPDLVSLPQAYSYCYVTTYIAEHQVSRMQLSDSKILCKLYVLQVCISICSLWVLDTMKALVFLCSFFLHHILWKITNTNQPQKAF